MLHSLECARSSKWANRVNAFLRSPVYILLVSALAAVGSVLGLDLVVYTGFILTAVYICLLGEDLLPMMPLVILCYLAPSRENNPGRNPESIFYPQHGGIYLGVLAALFVACLIFRLATDGEIGRKAFFTRKRKLLGGMLILGVTYLLGGIGLENYSEVAGKTVLFGLVQFAAVTAMYFLFTGTVKWEKTPKNYLAWVGMCAGFVVLIQLLENYFSGRLFIEGTLAIDREKIATGWGMHNNVGGMMAMMVPFCFYLACREKHGWVYNLLAVVLTVGVVMSCSRSSMLMAAAAFAVCAAVLLLRHDKGRKNLVLYGIAAAVMLAVLLIFRERLLDLFSKFLSDDLTAVSSRDKLIVNGFKQFLTHPIFGGSFFPQGEYVPWDWSELEAFTSFFPPRWHNTLIQMLASCGAVGMVAYAIHRIQTVRLLWSRRSLETGAVAVFMAVLLGASLLDCHFFNVGPVLFYSMALAFAERIAESKE